MAFERCYDEDLGTFPTHAESYQLERKGFAGTAGSQKNHIGVFIYAAIEDINYDKLLLCWLTPSRMPFSSLISNEVKG